MNCAIGVLGFFEYCNKFNTINFNLVLILKFVWGWDGCENTRY